MSTNYPTAVYRNKLLLPNFLRSENRFPSNIIDANVEGDWLLHTYIVKLDEEIFSEMPEGLGPAGEAFWVDDNWSALTPKLVDESRKHGWCILQFYADEEIPWRIFTISTFSDWIKEPVKDAEGNLTMKRMGAKFSWADDLENVGTEECRFDDPDCYLIKFREGDGRLIFAYSDLPDALLDVVFNIRQVKGQMDFIGSKPGFKHFVYGDDADPDNIADMDEQLKCVDTSAGIGVPKRVLDHIETVTDNNINVVLPIFDKSIEVFAGMTRLPISYYMGQRSGGGLGEEAEKIDLLKIDRKKRSLFKHYEPLISYIFYAHYGITIGDLDLPQDETLDNVETEDPISGNDPYEQSDQRTNSEE